MKASKGGTMSEPHFTRVPSAEEVELALRRCWQPVARVQDLQHGPQRAVLLGETLAVFVTESGKAAVLADRCPHRGASLSMGAVRGEGIQCPYHGWEWTGGDGVCLRIPSLADQGQIPPTARVPAFPAREQWGLVWTVLEEPLGKPPSLPWFDETRWRWGHGGPYELPVSFGVMIENFRDVAHFAFVHQATLGATPEMVEPLEVEREGFEVKMAREMPVGEGAAEFYGERSEFHIHTIAPNLTSARMFTPRGQRCLLHVARAISSEESAHYWIQGLGEDFEGEDLEVSIAFEERVYAEDLPIISAIRPAELPLDPRSDVSTLSDRYTLAYREAYVEFVRQALVGGAAQLS
jgi:phenylpropionate dioxygenase-like ring-hydroxylating dioxygenase large terminal subunit